MGLPQLFCGVGAVPWIRISTALPVSVSECAGKLFGRLWPNETSDCQDSGTSWHTWTWQAFCPGELSVGQRQRVAVVRALVHDPAIVFADEPTASVDDETARRIMNLLRDQVVGRDKLLVVATHDPRMIRHTTTFWNSP